MSKYKKILFPLVSVIAALLIGLLLLLVSKDPLAVNKISDLVIGNFRSKNAFLDLLGYFSIYGLVGIAVAIGFKGGLFNIGVSGQMMFAGVMCFIVIAWGNQKVLNPFVIFLIAVLSAMFIGLITILLKVYGNVHEVVSTIMLNWAILYFYQFIQASAPQEFLETNGASISFPINLLVNLNIKGIITSAFNIGIFIFGALVVTFWFIFRFTKLGYNIKTTGINAFAVKYVGLKNNRIMIYTMLLSSFVAGVAGFIYYFGLARYLPVQTVPLLVGFDGITVALLGSNSFIGIIFSALFVSAVYTQKVVMSGNKEVIEIVIAISLLTIALSFYFLTKPQPQVAKWYLQRNAKRQQQLSYSLTGFGRWYLKFLIIKDDIYLQFHYWINKVDIYYSYFEGHIVNWLNYLFKGNKLKYLAKKAIVNVSKEYQLINYWKDYEVISLLKINFAQNFATKNESADRLKNESLEMQKKAMLKAVKAIIMLKSKTIKNYVENSLLIINEQYLKTQQKQSIKIKHYNDLLANKEHTIETIKKYETDIKRIGLKQAKIEQNFQEQSSLIKEKTKEAYTNA